MAKLSGRGLSIVAVAVVGAAVMLLASLNPSSSSSFGDGVPVSMQQNHLEEQSPAAAGGEGEIASLGDRLRRHPPAEEDLHESRNKVAGRGHEQQEDDDSTWTDVQRVVARRMSKVRAVVESSTGAGPLQYACVVAPGEEYLQKLLKKSLTGLKVIFFDTTTEIGSPFSLRAGGDGVTTLSGRRRLTMTHVLSDMPTSKCQLFILDGDGPASSYEVMYLRGMADDRSNIVVASRPWLAKLSDAAAMVRDARLPGLPGGFPEDAPVGSVFLRRFDAAPIYRSPELDHLIHEAPWRDVKLDKYNEVGAALDQEAAKAGGGLEGHSGQLVKERQLYIKLASMPNVKTICEIGFNAGHSASLWLLANPTARVIAFDLFLRPYVQHNLDFLKSARAERELGLVDVGRRLEVYSGSSTETVPNFIKTNPNLRCDLLSVDGSHHMEDAIRDINNMRALANETFNVLVIDDTNCHMGWCVDETTMRQERDGIIKSLVRLAEHPDLHEHRFQRGVTMFQYFPKK